VESHTQLKEIPLAVSKDAVIEKMGGKNHTAISRRMTGAVERVLDDIAETASAQAIYAVLPVNNVDGNVTLDDQHTISSKKVQKVLGPCQKAVVFVTTIGPRVDQLIQQKMQEQPHYGFILDTAASVAAETAAQYLYDHIDQIIEDDQGLTMRYSPGYCDWPVTEQKKLFNLLPSNHIGVTLTETACMSPRKSVSGVIGICSADTAKEHGNACTTCKKTDCPFRRQ
jgi:cobalamin-dependent methionine synthase I